MSVKTVNENIKFQCLSSDDFPMDAPHGARMHVVDTGEMYVFHENMWVPDIRIAAAIKKAHQI